MVIEYPNHIEIIDYKSNVLNKAKLNALARDPLQLKLYKWAYRSMNPDCKPIKVGLESIETGEQKWIKVKPDFEPPILERVEKAGQMVLSNDFPANPSYQACMFCSYAKMCPSSAV